MLNYRGEPPDWDTTAIEAGPARVTVRRSSVICELPLSRHFDDVLLVREGSDVLGHRHFPSVVEVSIDERVVRKYILASFSPDQPRVAFAASVGYLLLGSFQTLYSIKIPECHVVFEVPLPWGFSVSDLRILTDAGGEIALVVSDCCVRLVEMSGSVRWTAEFLDPVEIVAIDGNSIVCRSAIPQGFGGTWTAKIRLTDGVIECSASGKERG
jgi:hypothetical protein